MWLALTHFEDYFPIDQKFDLATRVMLGFVCNWKACLSLKWGRNLSVAVEKLRFYILKLSWSPKIKILLQ